MGTGDGEHASTFAQSAECHPIEQIATKESGASSCIAREVLSLAWMSQE